jgi:hypothetical protein
MRVVNETTDKFYVVKHKKTGHLFLEFAEKTPENPRGILTIGPSDQKDVNEHPRAVSWVEEAYTEHNDERLKLMLDEYENRFQGEFEVVEVKFKQTCEYIF